MRDITRLGGSRIQGPMGALSRRVCPECGKAFECGVEWAYKRSVHNSVRVYYCSYRCYRVKGRKDEERERERIARENERIDTESEHKKQQQERRKQEQRKRARAGQCRERIAHYMALSACYPKGSRERTNARKSAWEWRRKLAACEEASE